MKFFRMLMEEEIDNLKKEEIIKISKLEDEIKELKEEIKEFKNETYNKCFVDTDEEHDLSQSNDNLKKN